MPISSDMRIGLSTAEVEHIMGSPKSVTSDEISSILYEYSTMKVTLRDDRVVSIEYLYPSVDRSPDRSDLRRLWVGSTLRGATIGAAAVSILNLLFAKEWSPTLGVDRIPFLGVPESWAVVLVFGVCVTTFHWQCLRRVYRLKNSGKPS